jgi:DNA primase catalytic subunit
MPVKYMAFSGSKGFHISCPDSKSYKGNPLQRELATLEERKRLVADVEAEGIKIDGKITADTRRIVRVPGTVNSKSGYMCRLIDEDELIDSSAKNILAKTPKKAIKPLQRKAREEQDDVHLGIKTNITGTKRSILSMSFRSYRKAKHALISLESYGIPLAFLLKKGRSFTVVSPLSLDMPRLLKICNSLSKADRARYSRYGYTTFPADATPLFHRILCSAKDHAFSRSHMAYLLRLFRLPPMGERMCGKDRLSMDIGVME